MNELSVSKFAAEPSHEAITKPSHEDIRKTSPYLATEGNLWQAFQHEQQRNCVRIPNSDLERVRTELFSI